LTGFTFSAYREGPGGAGRRPAGVDPSVVLGAVREDIRQTLRMGWVEPALDAAAAFPVFFTAAWSAIRPNVGRSFLLLCRALRSQATEAVRTAMEPPDLRKRLEPELSEEELRRVEDSVRAAHLATAKAQVVVHALHRAVRRERIAGTGLEEPPIRRGVPDWQRWMSLPPPSARTSSLLAEAVAALGLAVPPASLRLLGRWPPALAALWESVRPAVATPAWREAAGRLQRTLLSGICTLPHPVDLQWTALRARGFTEAQRLELARRLAVHDASMASQTLVAAYAWASFGAPDIGVEG
jgi:hypothetical protein